MARRFVVRPGKLVTAVFVLLVPLLVLITCGSILSTPHDVALVAVGLGTALSVLFCVHSLLNRFEIDADRVVIFGRALRREFLRVDVVAVDIEKYLTFYLRTGDTEYVEIVDLGGMFPPWQLARAQRVLTLTRCTLDLENVPTPPPEADPYRNEWPRPASTIVKRSINWPPLWLLTAWALWLIGIFIYRAH